MSFDSWLRDLRSALVPGRADRRRRRRSPGAATHRPRLELLEDRCVLSFSPAAGYAVGTAPQAVVTADFNGDGRLDLAVVNYNDSSVSVLLGNGNGTFQDARNATTVDPAVGRGYGPQSVAVGDFDGDGKLDLATGNSADVSVLLGNGDGTFAPPSITDLGSSLSKQSLAVGDFDGDGKMDLGVTSNVYYRGYYHRGYYHPGGYFPGGYGYGYWRPGYYDPGYYDPGSYEGRASVLLGNGDGSFSTPNVTSLGTGYHASAAAARLNGDDIDDFVTFNADYGTVNVLLGDGGGYLQYYSDFYTGYYADSVAAGDVNGDGNIDVVTENFYANNVSVLLGDGTGSFYAAADSATGGYPASVVLGDFTGDGRLDVATTNFYSNDLSVLRGLGDGTFAAPVNSAVGSYPEGVAAGDFDGDAFPDVAVANSGSTDVSVLLNTTDWRSFRVTTSSSTAAGEDLSVTVTALDNAGNDLVGYAGTVHFSSSDPHAVLPADYTFTPGNATHTFAVKLETAGVQSLTVRDTTTSAFAGSQAGIVVNPAAASRFTVAGFPSPRPVGVAGFFSVTAFDAFGNAATNYTGKVHFSSPADAAAALPPDYTFTPDDRGSHTFGATFFTDGTQSLTATDTAAAGVSGTQGNIEVTTASRFIVFGFPSPISAGTAGSFTVVTRDVYGNEVLGYRGVVHLTSTDGQATLPADYVFTAADRGVHTFTATLRTGGTQSITVTGAGGVTGTQGGITVRVPPTATVTGPSAGVRGQSLAFTLGASEPGLPAGTSFTYRIDWDGNGTVDESVSGPNGTQVSHAYAASNAYTVRVYATDPGGVASAVVTKPVSITAAALQADPSDPARTILVVGGTQANDTITFSQDNLGNVGVTINGASQGTYARPTGYVLAFGYEGNDTISAATSVTVPLVLLGGDGADVLQGGGGRDVLIGGLGSDTLRGGGGDDVLIGGYTDYDANLAALCAVMKEWTRADADYNTRVKHLSGTLGGGWNLIGTTPILLTASTVHVNGIVNDDNAVDNLYGEAGSDWFFARKTSNKRDKVNDQATGEIVTTIS